MLKSPRTTRFFSPVSPVPARSWISTATCPARAPSSSNRSSGTWPYLMCAVSSASRSLADRKPTMYGVRANCWAGSRPSVGGRTISPASPDGCTRRRSYTKASRSALPWDPAVTSLRIRPQSGPRNSSTSRRMPDVSRLTSWMATTSSPRMISATYASARRFRLGDPGFSSHSSYTPPNLRIFQVPTSRFWSAILQGSPDASIRRRSRAMSSTTV